MVTKAMGETRKQLQLRLKGADGRVPFGPDDFDESRSRSRGITDFFQI